MKHMVHVSPGQKRHLAKTVISIKAALDEVTLSRSDVSKWRLCCEVTRTRIFKILNKILGQFVKKSNLAYSRIKNW